MNVRLSLPIIEIFVDEDDPGNIPFILQQLDILALPEGKIDRVGGQS